MSDSIITSANTKCAKCASDIPSGNAFCGACGTRVNTSEASLNEAIRAVLKEEFKDQKFVEVETTQAIVSRLTDWAKLFGFFVAIPATLLVATLAVWGVSKFADVNKKLAVAQQKAKALQDSSADLDVRYQRLKEEATRYEDLSQEVQALRTDVSKIGRQIGFVPSSALTPELQKKLEGELVRFVQYMQGLGYMPKNEKVELSVVDQIPGASGGTVSTFSGHKLVVSKTYALEDGAVLEEYMHIILDNKGGWAEVVPYQSVRIGLSRYFPGSFLGHRLRDYDSKSMFPNLAHVSSVEATDKINEGGHILQSAFWSVREQIGSKILDIALFRAWVETQNDYHSPSYDKIFITKLLALLGPDAAKAGNILATRGIYANQN